MASTPIWAAANTRTATAFLVSDEAFVFPFPDPAHYPDLQSAINFAIGKLTLNGAVAVEIDTSETYPQTGSLDLTIDVPSGCTVELRAADVKRPTLLLNNEISITGRRLQHLRAQRTAHRCVASNGAGHSNARRPGTRSCVAP